MGLKNQDKKSSEGGKKGRVASKKGSPRCELWGVEIGVVVEPPAHSSGLPVHTPRSVHRAASGWKKGSRVQLGGCAWTGKEGGGQVGRMTVGVEGLTVRWASRSNKGGQSSGVVL